MFSFNKETLTKQGKRVLLGYLETQMNATHARPPLLASVGCSDERPPSASLQLTFHILGF